MAISDFATLAAEAQYGTGGLQAWISNNIITLVILLLGIAILWASRSGNVGKAITIGAGMLIGIGVLGLASGSNAADIGTFMVSLFKG